MSDYDESPDVETILQRQRDKNAKAIVFILIFIGVIIMGVVLVFAMALSQHGSWI